MNSSSAPSSRIGLSLLVFFANAFLVIALASSLTGVLHNVTGAPALASLDVQLSALLVVLGLIVIAELILVPHLPRLVLLPPLLTLLWVIVGAPGMPPLSPQVSPSLAQNGAMLVATLFGLTMNKLSYGTWLIPVADLPYFERLTTRTLIAAPIAALVLLFLSVFIVLAAIPTYIEDQSRGYLHFASNGLEVRHTTLTKGDNTVHLIGMVHIGEPKFYRDLYKSFEPQSLILAEGVTDKSGKLSSKPGYDRAARGLGLESQSEFQSMLQGSNKVDEPAPAQTPPTQPAPAAPSTPQAPNPNAPFVVFADADISELSPDTIRFIEAAGSIFQSSSLSEAAQRYMALAGQFNDAQVQAVMKEIVLKRNEKALAAFDKYEPQFKIIYLPWGALHMPDFEDKLVARGYKIQSTKMLPIARYQTILDAISGASPQQTSGNRIPTTRIAAAN